MNTLTRPRRGLLASQSDCEYGTYSDLRVLESGAGFYIGTMFTHNEESDTPGMVEPGSRESQYFGTREDAEASLRLGNWQQRKNP